MIDRNRNVILCGSTKSSNYPVVTGSYNVNFMGTEDAMITKLNSSGSSIIFSTFVGGSEEDGGIFMVFDRNDNIVVSCLVFSSDFPVTTGAFQSNKKGSWEGALVKLNSTGTSLISSTYFGGSVQDEIEEIAIDQYDNIYIIGATNNTSDFPLTSGAFQTYFAGGSDAYVAKMNPDFTNLIYSTLIGGAIAEGGQSIQVDASGFAYAGINTSSDNYPTTPGTFQPNKFGSDVFAITKFNTDGTGLVFSTFIGAYDQSGDQRIERLKIDNNGNSYFAGFAQNSSYPVTTGAYQTQYGGGGSDAIITKLNNDGTALIFSSYLGGSSGYDQIRDFSIDGNGNVYVSGGTTSQDFPTTAGCPNQGKLDVFISKLNSSGTSLIYSLLLGGSRNDMGLGFGLDGSGNVYISGGTNSSDFPVTSNAYDTTFNGGGDDNWGYVYGDCFVTKLIPPFEWPSMAAQSNIVFDSLLCGTMTLDTFWIKNTSFCEFYLSRVNFTGAASGDFALVEPESLPITIYERDSARIIVKFEPKASGERNSVMNLVNTTYTNPFRINLFGVKNYIKVNFESTNADTLKLNIVTCPGNIIDTSIRIKNLSTLPTSINFTVLRQPYEYIGMNSERVINLGLNESKEIRIRFNGSEIQRNYYQTFSFTDTCGKIKTVVLNVDVKAPNARAGKDTTICKGDYLVIGEKTTGGTPPYTYKWKPAELLDDPNKMQPLVIKLFEKTDFIVEVTDQIGCKGYDTITVSLDPEIYIEPSADVFICYGSGAKLRKNISGGTQPYKYKWIPEETLDDPNSSSPIATPLTHTMYYVTITDRYGCSKKDSIKVNVYPELNVKLDTTALTICPGEELQMRAAINGGLQPYRKINWYPENGLDDPNIINPKLIINKSGKHKYYISVEDAVGCKASDSIEITVFEVTPINIKGERAICSGAETKLWIEKNDELKNYRWSTGSDRDTIIVNQAGKYHIEAINKNGCKSYDTITVIERENPKAVLQLNKSPELCFGDSVEISLDKTYISQRWSTGSNDPKITVSKAGVYYAEVTDENGCKGISDTVTITIVDSLRPVIILENNGILCSGKSLKIATKYPYSQYKWNTGETTREITVSKGGKYKVFVKNESGCGGTSDEMEVKEIPAPIPKITGSPFICPGRTDTLSVTQDFVSYNWSTSDTTKLITIDKAGVYAVTVTDTNGCEGSASFEVKEIRVQVSGIMEQDFGRISIGSDKAKTIIIRNESDTELEITEIKVKSKPDNFKITTKPALPHTLQQKEELEITIRFKPDEAKKYEDTLIIETGKPCQDIFASRLAGEGINATLQSRVWLPDTNAQTGTLNYRIPLKAMLMKDTTINNLNYNAEIRFDAAYYQPEAITKGNLEQNTIENGERILKISGNIPTITTKETILTEISGLVLLGKPEPAILRIISFDLSGPEISIIKTDGSLTVTGVCNQGFSNLVLTNEMTFEIAANPIENELIINIRSKSKEEPINIQIFNLLGECVLSVAQTFPSVDSGQTGMSDLLRVDVSGLTAGIYFVRVGDWVGRFLKI